MRTPTVLSLEAPQGSKFPAVTKEGEGDTVLSVKSGDWVSPSSLSASTKANPHHTKRIAPRLYHLQEVTCRRLSRNPLRYPALRQESQLHRRSGSLPGAGHRRYYGDLQRSERRTAPSAALYAVRPPDPYLHGIPELSRTAGCGISGSRRPEFLDLKRDTKSFAAIEGWVNGGVNLAGASRTGADHGVERQRRHALDARREPDSGPLFTSADDDRPNVPLTAVISYGLWQRAFGGDPGIIGRDIRLNGNPAT